MPCYKCGCEDERRLANRLYCRFCGASRPAPMGKDSPDVGHPNSPARPIPQKAGVPYFVLRCPECNSKNVKQYKAILPVRYHVCKDCDHRFKSREQ